MQRERYTNCLSLSFKYNGWQLICNFPGRLNYFMIIKYIDVFFMNRNQLKIK